MAKQGLEAKLPVVQGETSLQLKTWFDTAQDSPLSMNMRVEIIDQKNKVLYQAYTQHDQSLRLDIDSLPVNTELRLRYEFFERTLATKVDSRGDQSDVASGEEPSCNLPHFTQELVVISKRLVKSRVETYMEQRVDDKPSLEQCLSELSNLTPDEAPVNSWEQQKVERGAFCDTKTYYYKASQHQAGDTIAKKKFTVTGVDNRAITQFVQIDIGYEFLYSPNLAVVMRLDNKSLQTKNSNLECLYDGSCQVSRPTHKNH